ncbi:EamA family transporter [Actinocorallia sp. B10E7]|uniref:EamA family transporter n=1 Tax=Actinocorallia sp. B10E7 TaxID=3153558 RepID=UPI00325CBAE0
MVTVMALAAALFYGVGDFFGGAASRRATALSVLMVSIPLGLALLAVAALAGGDAPDAAGVGWGLASGLASGVGFLALYRALAIGPMSVVAPVSALAGAVVPVAAGLLAGERFSGTVMSGVVLCVAAIGLVSMEPGKEGRSPWVLGEGLSLALVAGTAFGVFFVLLSHAGEGSGLWPLVLSRAGVLTVVLGVVVLLACSSSRPPVSMPRGRTTWALALGAGALDVVANVAYFKAVNAGMLSIVGVLTSLYPAVTVLLAWLVHKERLQVAQRFGLVVALTGVALVTSG